MKLYYIAAAMMLVLSSTVVQAGSIWAKRDKISTTVYTDDTARQVGDVLTIIIAETSKVDNKVNRDLKKSTDRSVDFNGELGITTPNHNILPRMPGVDLSAQSNNQLSGQSDYKDERSFDDRITVVVEDVQASGNLVVIGTRTRDVAGDKQTITVSGIVRPSDISFQNTILSQQVANFTIVSKNAGYSETYNKPGWLGQIFDFLWPF